ncbi:hypothetical protein [Rubritalea tangerina]
MRCSQRSVIAVFIFFNNPLNRGIWNILIFCLKKEKSSECP